MKTSDMNNIVSRFSNDGMISCSVLQVLYCLHIALATSISYTSRLIPKLAIIDVAVSDDDKMN